MKPVGVWAAKAFGGTIGVRRDPAVTVPHILSQHFWSVLRGSSPSGFNVDWHPHPRSDTIGVVKTVQMTLDEELVAQVDRAARRLKTTRSGFTRQALRDALRRIATTEREARHRRGYEAKPVKPGEFDVWTDEQVWPE
jgi:Arc/MetJ family transcription regulator